MRMLGASAALIGRHPKTLGGLVIFGVVFSFVAANALWYQPRRHPAPFLATRSAEGVQLAARQPADEVEPGVTVFRIERETPPADSDAVRPAPSALVREIQERLAARGLYDGPADGLPGPKTEAAILFFEQTEGMAETGEASDTVLARLRAVAVDNQAVSADNAEAQSDDTLSTASTRPVAEDEVAALIAASDAQSVAVPADRPPSPAVVMQIQKALAGMAYADVKVDGIAGEATRTAIRAFEKSYRMPVTGEPSERVLAKLKSIGAL
jgi:peptidoglycan hydrolase-like protein with peptidoglycan-binding domain